MKRFAAAALLLARRKRIRSLFVMSTGRCGTTTIARLFGLDPTVESYHEPRPVLFAERARVFKDRELSARWIARKILLARGLEIIGAHARSAYYVETSAFLSFFTPALQRILPRAAFVFTYRHPADVIRSGMRRKWYESHPGDVWRIVPREGTPAAARWNDWSRFQKICWYWSAYNELCLDCYYQLDPARRMMVPAEALWSGEGHALARDLFHFAGLPTLPETKVKEVLQTAYNSQVDSDFPQFFDWDAGMKAQLAEIAGDTMRKLGYGADVP